AAVRTRGRHGTPDHGPVRPLASAGGAACTAQSDPPPGGRRRTDGIAGTNGVGDQWAAGAGLGRAGALAGWIVAGRWPVDRSVGGGAGSFERDGVAGRAAGQTSPALASLGMEAGTGQSVSSWGPGPGRPGLGGGWGNGQLGDS